MNLPPNRLHDAASPYLRQHAADPVRWQPWDAAAVAFAASHNSPILLSIGYSACHWCHVMARESFADPATAELINELFVPIKVDREERPDLDRQFLAALARLGRPAGWPLTGFLTPSGELYAGGGYFPPEPAFGLPAFRDVLRDAARRFAEPLPSREEPSHTRPKSGGTTRITDALRDRVAHNLARSVDFLYGGFGTDPPKFLHAGGHEILLRAWARSGDAGLLQAATGSLTAICNGAVYDHVGGGFHRYAADDRWLVPHFEKMLCDNALMVALLVKAWQATHAEIFAHRVAQTVAWLLREMRLANGAFACSLAAGGDDEGAFYTWAPGEIGHLLRNAASAFAAAYGESDEGPFAPRSVLFRTGADDPEPVVTREAVTRLMDYRDRRPRPYRDEKLLADWNGLAITALVDAGLAFDRPDWIDAANSAFHATVAALTTPHGLRHSVFAGATGPQALLEDYACLAQAALALFEVSGDERLVAKARAWTDTLDAAFWDGDGGYAMSTDGPAAVRQVLIDETVAPAGNAVMLGVLPRLALLSGEPHLRDRAEAIIRRFGDRLTRASLAGATALNNSAAIDCLVQVTLVAAAADPSRVALLRELTSHFTPDRLLLMCDSNAELAPSHPAAGKTTVDGRATVYVCVGPACLAPVTTPVELRRILAEARPS